MSRAALHYTAAMHYSRVQYTALQYHQLQHCATLRWLLLSLLYTGCCIVNYIVMCDYLVQPVLHHKLHCVFEGIALHSA